MFNLKKSNLFVNGLGEVQITDIAIPVILDKELEEKEENLNLAMYSAPEIDNQLLGITYKCDIWSLGVIFYELYKSCHPFQATTGKEAAQLISKGFDGMEMSDGIIDEIIKNCLNNKPALRPSLANINRSLKDLAVQEEIDLEAADVRRTSYGLVSPNNK